MFKFNLSANLFRNAYSWVSKEETRYYLQGVYVQPHPVMGAFLVSTDGHGLIVVYDRSAIVTEAAIVKLTPDALKACKPGARDTDDMRLISNGEELPLEVKSGEKTIALSYDWKVDGTYPDWQRVCPSHIEKPTAAHFNPVLLARMTKVGEELEHDNKRAARPMTIIANGQGPALVHFNFPDAFGVLMPVRSMRDYDEAKIPAWVNERPAQQDAAE